jgi:hypothetical protein
MLFSLAYFLVGRILGTGQRPNEGKEIELLVLRHQVRVLQRQVKAPPSAASRPAPAGGGEQGDAQRPVVFVRCQARDAAPLASGARQTQVDVPEEAKHGPAKTRSRDRRLHPALS